MKDRYNYPGFVLLFIAKKKHTHTHTMRTRGIARTKKVTIDLPETPFDAQGSSHVKSRKPNGKDSAIKRF
jgi:hypothetical protein